MDLEMVMNNLRDRKGAMPPDAHDWSKEDLVFGNRYRPEMEISRGPAASVYRSDDVQDNCRVAIKVFRERYQADPRFAIRFRKHLKALTQFASENLVNVLDYGRDHNRYYIVMEWVEGIDLGSYIAEYGRLEPALAVHIARQVCTALEVVHKHGLIHRDIKPGNILIRPDGMVKLSDTGFNELLSETGLSKTNVMLGGVGYLSPEQALGKNLTPAADLYSLGVSLFEMLTARLPFEADSAWAMVSMHANQEAPSPQLFNPQVPETLAALVTRSLQKDPAERFGSPAEMGAALAELKSLDGYTFEGGRPRRRGRDVPWFPILRELLEPEIFRHLMRTPVQVEIAQRSIPFGVILAVMFGLAFLLTFALVYLLA
jgi:serine/threonine protein kinase